jgi:Sec-independent protein translocase protein TatA
MNNTDLSIEELFILAVVALFVLGRERLPSAAAWLARTLRQIKTLRQRRESEATQ